MDVWDSFWSGLAEFIAANGLVAVALIVLLRSAAIPIPVPADLLVIVVGARARDQQFLLWPAWFVLAVSTTVGAALLYTFVRWIGPGEIGHYGRYVGLSNERLSAAETQLGERGARAVFAARIVPGLRVAIVAVCGMLRFRWWKFVAAVMLGALIYVGLCLAIGYVFGDSIVGLVGDLVFPFGVLEPALGLGILLFWLVRARRSTPNRVASVRLSRAVRVRVGALAGALAIVGSTMLLNVLVYLLVPAVAETLSEIRGIDAVFARSGGLGIVLLLVVNSVPFGILRGILYANYDQQWGAAWRDWLRGLAFATLPFLVGVVVQTLAVLQAEQAPTTWLILALGEAIRWGTYGVLIGLTYPVLRARRLQPAASDDPSAGHVKLSVESAE